MEFIELAKKRFSVRKYVNKPIEREKLDLVLEAARVAPTAKNLQPQRIYVIQSAEGLAKVDALTPCRFGAPTVLLFTNNTDEEWNNPLEASVRAGVEDVSIVATHAMLEAEDLGLGTCWVNYFPNTELEKAFGLPKNERSVLLMPIGYPASDAAPGPNHAASKKIEEFVKFI
ncbi:MAG: nitroreductase family protein [Thermoguttaceae bacterium]|nr:nitroreductase family protein [Thermoguttaceae bacterium]